MYYSPTQALLFELPPIVRKRHKKRGRKSKINNKLFYTYQKQWNTNKSKTAWEGMFQIVLNIALSTCKSMAKGFRMPDLEGKALDATLEVMKRYTYPPKQFYNLVLFGEPELKPYEVGYIVTVVRWACIGSTKGKNLMLNERMISRDQMLEDMAEKETELDNSNGFYNALEME